LTSHESAKVEIKIRMADVMYPQRAAGGYLL